MRFHAACGFALITSITRLVMPVNPFLSVTLSVTSYSPSSVGVKENVLNVLFVPVEYGRPSFVTVHW